MIEIHDCAEGTVVNIERVPVEYVNGCDWTQTLYDAAGVQIAIARTVIPPNFCFWCARSLQEV